MSDPLKLIALDSDDLAVVSAVVQDAILKVGDIETDGQARQAVLTLRRFVREASRPWWKVFGRQQRSLSVLHFNRVRSVRSFRLDRNDSEGTLVLLSATFEPDEPDAAAGAIRLTFAGESELVLQVDAIEAQLSDLGARWAAVAKPDHSTTAP